MPRSSTDPFLIAMAALTMDHLSGGRAAAQRRAQAAAWKAELAAARARVATVDAARLRLRSSYNQLVLTSHARDQRLLASVHRLRRLAAQR